MKNFYGQSLHQLLSKNSQERRFIKNLCFCQSKF